VLEFKTDGVPTAFLDEKPVWYLHVLNLWKFQTYLAHVLECVFR
jgi:hypothetical protein